MYRNRVRLFKTFFFAYLFTIIIPSFFSSVVSFLSFYSLFLPLASFPYTQFPSFLAFQKTGVFPIMASNFSPVLILQQYFTRRFEQVS